MRINNDRTSVCPVCGKSVWKTQYNSFDRLYGEREKFSIRRCIGCRLAALYPQPSIEGILHHYTKEKYYTSLIQSEENAIFAVRKYLIQKSTDDSFISNILRCVFPLPAIPIYKSHSNILDIGCGGGQTLKVLDDLGWDTYGIDIDPHAVRMARSKGLHHILHGSYTKLNMYPDNFFDTIRLYHVIEHLDRPDICVRLAYAKLKKGGELLIGTPNIDSLIGILGGTYWFNLDTPRHLYIFTPQTLRRLLQKYGFRVKGLQYGSGGGIIGTIQYYVSDVVKKKVDFISHHWLMILFYPVDWILDRIHVGDVFTMTATK